jgi:predicted metalloprotease with PDZ domain
MVIPHPDPQGQVVSLPNWIPGSYLIRDFARHIVTLDAFSNQQKVAITKINSNTWQCEKITGPLTLSYSVYAFDSSIRGAFLNDEHAFFNGSALFLMAHGQEDVPCKLQITPPNIPDATDWRVATTLTRNNAPNWGFGEFIANSYDELIDHPVQIGNFETVEFQARGIPHTIVVTGKHDGDLARLASDVQKICQTHLDLFQDPPLFAQYLFLLTVRKDAYGGLEHRSSTALQIQRESMPLKGDLNTSLGYMSLLGLFSHEYFHAWMIKRIKPACFLPYDLDHKALTEQLWAFEGITSYYDELALVRAKVITPAQYFDYLAQSITKLLRNPGRKKQTLAQSSYDAWIKFYQPNENSPNATVSYYLKGSLVGLALDLSMRQESNNTLTLDEIMRQLWQDFGKPYKGLQEKEINKIIESMGSKSTGSLLNQALYGTEDLPLAKLFDHMGLTLTLRAALSLEDTGGHKPHPSENGFKTGWWGIVTSRMGDRVIVSHVLDGTAAQRAGIGASDEIVAINDIRVDHASFEKLLKRLGVNQTINVHIFRQDILQIKTLTLQPPMEDTAQITLKPALTEQEKQNLQQWLFNGF